MPLNFHAPITGPGRSAWIEAARFGLPISMADGMGGSSRSQADGRPGSEWTGATRLVDKSEKLMENGAMKG